jgi:hypothetical protein
MIIAPRQPIAGRSQPVPGHARQQMVAAPLHATQPVRALDQQRHELAGGPERVGDHMVIVERDRSPQLATDLGDHDHATRRACRIELGEAVGRVGVGRPGVARRQRGTHGLDRLSRTEHALEEGGGVVVVTGSLST